MKDMAASEEAALRRPASASAMFFAFTRMALQGFGGVLPVTQRMLVEQERWLSPQQYVRMLSLAQVLPGPNVVNLSLMVGDRFFGTRGAFAAMAGMLAAPLVVVLALAVIAAQLQSQAWAAGALKGMGVVSAGLVIGTALKLAGSLKRNPLGVGTCAAAALLAFGAVGVLRWPLVFVVLGLGGLCTAWAWWRMGATP
jgi:chromate transporter